MIKKNYYYIKTNRIFNSVRQYGWMFTLLVAIGGLWEPKLGLMVFLIMGGLTVTSFFKGRYWCGNFCPHGSLFDKIIMPVSLNKKIPNFLKSKTFITLFFGFFMVNLGRKMFNVMQYWGSYDFLDKAGALFVNTYLVVLIVGGLIAVLVNSRTWCQFCPMGTIQKISHYVGKMMGITKKTEEKITISNIDMCHSCGKCSRVCPFQLTPYLEFSDNNQFDNINCIKCKTCVENCPAGILSLSTEDEALKLKEITRSHGSENRHTITAQIASIVELDKDTKEYNFKFITPYKVNYKSGQFILIKIQDEPKAFRAYSISSYNEDGRALSVIIKRVERGYGTEIIFNEFKVGDTIELEGPLGDELILDQNAENVLFIANGIGITPFISLVKDALVNHENLKSVKLIAGQRFENQLLYHEYFNDLQSKDDRFEYIPIVSRDKKSSLKKGHVTTHLKDMNVSEYKVYMCGTKEMIKDSFNILLEKGLSANDISYESEEKVIVEEKVKVEEKAC